MMATDNTNCTLLFNTLMLEGVAVLLLPLLQGYFRSAGVVGYDAFEELVALQLVPICGEVEQEGVEEEAGIIMKCGGRGDREHAPMRSMLATYHNVTHPSKVVFYLRAIDIWSTNNVRWRSPLETLHTSNPPLRLELNPAHTSTPKGLLSRSFATRVSINMENVKTLQPQFLSRCDHLQCLELFDGGDEAPSSWRGHPSFTTIPEDFLLHSTALSSLDTTSFQYVTTIENGFLSYSGIVFGINLSPLARVTSIGNDFMSHCPKIKRIDMSPLRNVRSIGDYCLKNCEALTEVKLPIVGTTMDGGNDGDDTVVTPRLVAIGGYFLSGCHQLQSLPNLSFLAHLPTMPNHFLSGTMFVSCGQTVAHMTSLQSIGSHLFYKCSGLKAVDLSSLTNVTTIDKEFMAQCTHLQAIDMSHMTHISKIGSTFLAKCSSLRQVALPTLLPNSTIGGSFMMECTGLQSLDATPLRNVIEVGYSFLASTAIKSIDLSPLSKCSFGKNLLKGSYVTKAVMSFSSGPVLPHISENGSAILEGLLNNCHNLHYVDLSHAGNHATVVCDTFLSGCVSLPSIDLTPLQNITYICSDFMSGCEGMVSINLSPLANVTHIGKNCMSNCRSLTTINLKPLAAVKTIGTYFMGYTKRLKSVDLSPLRGVRSIGVHLFCECGSQITKEVEEFKSDYKDTVLFVNEGGNPVRPHRRR